MLLRTGALGRGGSLRGTGCTVGIDCPAPGRCPRVLVATLEGRDSAVPGSPGNGDPGTGPVNS